MQVTEDACMGFFIAVQHIPYTMSRSHSAPGRMRYRKGELYAVTILDEEMMTRLRMYRERMGLSQSELARESGISVRMIQHYEQRQKDLNKAQTRTVWLLARALHCSMEDLMEDSEPFTAIE